MRSVCHELALRQIPFEAQPSLPIVYKGRQLACGYRLDLLVNHLIIIELKSVEQIEPIHEAQLLTYLRLSDLWLGLLINFNVTILKSGIKRLVNG